ncbi:MAG: GGDEF domain-containing protein [Desulfarculaceae bacterium]|nr:GGDEF domain-containing protein [Desulfarculaceae bacterium]MCF8070824.1 GGDEF domain-containing protein [Desulfarculaceae bacterium]MCF8102261.1 GGDEF domain-containing protein [Desulfarculaceae bacterium]MCF8117677.1 GGDEF domain-containing protein [Desulfarculaceae bacterium]
MQPDKSEKRPWFHITSRKAAVRATMVVSGGSLLASWALTGPLMLLLADPTWEQWVVAGIASTLAPLMVAPFVAYKTFDLMRQLTESRREIERLSQSDDLTGTCNRRHFKEVAQRELALAQRNGYAVSLLLLDLDGFKQINDQLGHATGDRTLVACAEAIREAIREGDVLGRYGGDEFMVLAPHTGLEAAARLAERVRAAVARAGAALHRGEARLSASLGVAGIGKESSTADELLVRADRALYLAKAKGGDCIELAAS